jgi:hypothetical protein
VSGTFDITNGPSEVFAATPTVPADPGANAYNPTTSSDGKFLFDNLLYPEYAGVGTGNGILDWGGLLIEFSNGYELNIFSGSFGAGGGTTAPGDSYFYFADNGSYDSNNPITAGGGSGGGGSGGGGGPASGSLSAPEPGSLLLLGSGLFGLAFVLQRKAVKRSFRPVSNK